MKLLLRIVVVFCLFAFLVPESYSQKARTPKRKAVCGSSAAARDYLSLREHRAPLLRAQDDVTGSTGNGYPAGNIAVMEAGPELLILPNPFDLKARTLRFQPALGNRYTYSFVPYSFNPDASYTVTLKDDDSSELFFSGFVFPFGGKTYDHCYINSNGNITFDNPDPEPPSISTVMSGPPRIAPFFVDLDPEALGTVFVRQTTGMAIITWLKVPEFFNQEVFDYGQNTFQIVLYSSGMIDMIFSDEITATSPLVGILPGYGQSRLRRIDFSNGTLMTDPQTSYVENFQDVESVDIPALMRNLYTHFKDHYDFVTLMSNFELTPVPGAQAFSINVHNEIRGIGNPSQGGKPFFRQNPRYGSAGRLQNITFLGNLHDYPADPNQQMPDMYTSLLGILGHEVGHRWLSYVKLTRNGAPTDALIGRGGSHWNFFFQTFGSYLEGNAIQAVGSNTFNTGRPYQRYSDLDLYLMGLLPPEQVHDSFLVDGPGNFNPDFPFAPTSSPEPNVKFNGSKYPVHIQDIIAANGARKPDYATSQKQFRHLFVLIVRQGTQPLPEEISFYDLIRTQWQEFFAHATGGQGKVSTYID